MTKIKMSKREMMVEAHKMARRMVGDYVARLALALRTLWASAKKGVKSVEKLITNELGDIEVLSVEREEQVEKTGSSKGWIVSVKKLVRIGKSIILDTEYDIKIVRETEKAILLSVTEVEDDYTVETWVPKSVFNQTELGMEVEPWFAKKNRMGCAVNITRYAKEA